MTQHPTRAFSFIVTHFSLILGLLFVLGGHTPWTQLLAHGLYDTIAFIRIAAGAVFEV
jgi:hypothetical protein